MPIRARFGRECQVSLAARDFEQLVLAAVAKGTTISALVREIARDTLDRKVIELRSLPSVPLVRQGKMLHVKFSPGLMAQVLLRARELDTTFAALMRTAIRHYLNARCSAAESNEIRSTTWIKRGSNA